MLYVSAGKQLGTFICIRMRQPVIFYSARSENYEPSCSLKGTAKVPAVDILRLKPQYVPKPILTPKR